MSAPPSAPVNAPPGRPRAALRRWRADERGAATVEFAIIVPILLTLVMGIIDFGRMLAVAASLAAAVRDGARQAATASSLTDPTQLAAIRTRVVNGFQPFGGAALTPSNVAVSTATAPDGNINAVVSVTGYTYQPITPIAKLIGLGTVTFSRTTTFRWERTFF